MDGEIAKIRDELDEAKRLRVEAEAALTEAKERRNKASVEAEAILEPREI